MWRMLCFTAKHSDSEKIVPIRIDDGHVEFEFVTEDSNLCYINEIYIRSLILFDYYHYTRI